MKQIKVAIVGGTGKIGKEIIAHLANEPQIKEIIVCSRDVTRCRCELMSNPKVIIISLFEINESLQVDCWIDFSHPDSIPYYYDTIHLNKIPLIIGTSGLQDYYAHLHTLGTQIPVLHVINLSLGINLLFEAIGYLASKLPIEYQAEVIDMHHRNKADAPSQTALKIANIIQQERFEAHGIWSEINELDVQSRSNESIGIQSVRVGYGVGEHTVYFAGFGERIEITHRVFDRTTAVRQIYELIVWIQAQQPGLYNISDKK